MRFLVGGRKDDLAGLDRVQVARTALVSCALLGNPSPWPTMASCRHGICEGPGVLTSFLGAPTSGFFNRLPLRHFSPGTDEIK
ncbi:hypothetical protein AAY473_023115 [Plecturocebus cupreus]